MAERPADQDEILLRFNRLIQELAQGKIRRQSFQPWEVDLLLDIEKCQTRESARGKILRRY